MENETYIIVTILIVYTNGEKYTHSLKKHGNKNRTIPNRPIFKSNPAKITDPSVEASTCASGNQI
jgi:hypothetical protein